jgi:hypothetical protein
MRISYLARVGLFALTNGITVISQLLVCIHHV